MSEPVSEVFSRLFQMMKVLHLHSSPGSSGTPPPFSKVSKIGPSPLSETYQITLPTVIVHARRSILGYQQSAGNPSWHYATATTMQT